MAFRQEAQFGQSLKKSEARGRLAEMIDFEKMQSQIVTQGEMIAEIYRMLTTNEAPKKESSDKPMNIQEASDFLGIPVSTIYQSKKIPRKRRGKHLFFFKNELIDYINSGA
ncbi:helix-turn-helix domain-containing protein [Flectobacillus sp. DC10W]|uniref:Helix-turn-helix domain-containing protein n=1 Tax=Flectobacillus longus TaxID=2984207 RepID=A0ABT6YK90_9BACT|nr:helix-turn-helix domain-containing protein [Flectobacillus longus]MDI9864002.1 helix-turn-helix domain-containing protein [Flectobacillus longus]